MRRSVGGPLNAVVQMQFWAWEFTSDWEAWGQGSEEGGRMTFDAMSLRFFLSICY